MASPEEISTLELILTAGCNLVCSYCYQSDKKFRRTTPEIVRGAIDMLMRSRRRDLTLLIIGGEPLLEFGLFREAVEYAEQVRPPGKRVRLFTSTNGTLLDAERARFLASHRVRTQISFDGVPAAQDFRGRGTFEVLDRTLRRLRASDPRFFHDRISVAMTVHPATLPHMADSMRYFLRRGVREIGMQPIVTHDPAWKTESIQALDTAFARVYRLCLRHYRLTGEVPLKTFQRAERDSPHRPRQMQLCGAGGGHQVAVDVDGQVHGCLMFASSYQKPSPFLGERFEKMKMGDYRDTAFPERHAAYPEAAREARIFDDRQDKYSSYGACRDCRYQSECSICPVSIGNIPGNTDPRRIPDFGCAWNLVSLKYKNRFPRPAGARDILTGKARQPRLVRELLALAGRPVNRPSA